MCFGQQISAWLRSKTMDFMEDKLRTSMGMPTRKEERKQRKKAEKQARKNEGKFRKPTDEKRGSNPFHQRPDSIIPKEYAEDVEFTEFKEYSATATATEKTNPDGSESIHITLEEQVTDVEFVEYKISEKPDSKNNP